MTRNTIKCVPGECVKVSSCHCLNRVQCIVYGLDAGALPIPNARYKKGVMTMRNNRIATMLTDREVEILQDIIAVRYMDGERVSMSTLCRYLMFHPENAGLEKLVQEIT